MPSLLLSSLLTARCRNYQKIYIEKVTENPLKHILDKMFGLQLLKSVSFLGYLFITMLSKKDNYLDMARAEKYEKMKFTQCIAATIKLPSPHHSSRRQMKE